MIRLLRGSGLAFAVAGLVLLIVLNAGRLGAESATQGAVRDLLFHAVFLPRLAASLLCGAALGLSAAVLQQALQNPLAAPETLAINAGAQLSLTAALLFAPAIHADHPLLLALAGAFAAWALIAGLIWRHRSDPATVAMTGLVVSFVLGTLATLATIFNQEYLTSMLIWGAGSLTQDGWERVTSIVPPVAVGVVGIALLARSLAILGMGEASAASLGVSPRPVRGLAIAAAVLLAASSAAAAGAIGFIGLAAPHIARLLGARRLPVLLMASPIAGGLLLTIVDQALQLLPRNEASDIPTGAVTALLAAPLLILLLHRMPERLVGVPTDRHGLVQARRVAASRTTITLVALAAPALFCLSLFVARGPGGFTFLDFASEALAWRLPRALGAIAAGAALGVSGAIVQRLYGNPMASPEVLGVGAGVGAAYVATLLVFTAPDAPVQLTAAIAGAIVVCAMLASLGGGLASPQRLLLTGIALTALLNAATLFFLSTGDPRIGQMIAWLGGSIYAIDTTLAQVACVAAALGLVAALLMGRMLDAVSLGEDAARGRGLSVRATRMMLLGLSATVAGVASLVIGPMSFAGLIAPRIAALLGLRRARPQIAGAGCIGAALLLLSDWIGRVAFAPMELPAGLVAVLIGFAALAICAARG